MDHIMRAILVSDRTDEEKKLCIDHILASSLTSEQAQKVAVMCWQMWPEGTEPPSNVHILAHALKHLPNQFIVCARRYLNSSLTAESDYCFQWMQEESRHLEWVPVIKVLFLYLSMRPADKLRRVHDVFHKCPCVPFSTFLVAKDLYMESLKLAAVLMKCGRIPMRGHMGEWLKHYLLVLVQGEQWSVLVKGGTDVILNVSEQLNSRDTVHGSLVVLEIIFLGYQEAPDVFIAFFSHFYDRIEPWLSAAESLPEATLIYLHGMLQGLLFAFPGHPLIQAKLIRLCKALPPVPSSFDVEVYVDALRWKNCKQGEQSPFGLDDTSSTASESTSDFSSTSSGGGAVYDGLIGLRNLGNTCYMNSVLQGLYLTPAFRSLFLSSVSSTKRPLNGTKSTLVSEFKALLRHMNSAGKSSADSIYIHRLRTKLAAEYQTSRQQDASEFLHYLVDELATQSGQVERVARIFNGKITRRITCSRCGVASTTDEDFIDLNVPMPSTPVTVPLTALVQATQLGTEQLTDANAYYCEGCADRVDATKTTAVSQAPQHLIVTLSRFQYNLQRGVREKICTPVQIAQTFHLPVESNAEPVDYDLYAAIIHAGSRADYGHYYIFARRLDETQSQQPRQWFLLNDSRVSMVDEALVNHTLTQSASDTPYLLWYSRKP
ncbi:unnamed protein product [Aphanomyces euteiches]|uniref:USP domain-containing protein n=1 Tax=Aphanomyces euteiches TaxID=100861 RepID=A0A6G0X4M9_9STRA|nr:hypothetical protein Ae201684_008563 [Aphanomyces euteiches]KAH9153670.1 hypothetical protein AeRB84_004124 [Aphanomyces euteiches]